MAEGHARQVKVDAFLATNAGMNLVEQIKPNTSDCLKSQEIELLVAGQLTGKYLDRIVEHLADCQVCRNAVSGARTSGVTATIVASQSPPADTGIGAASAAKRSDLPTTEVTKLDPAAGQPKPVSLMFEFLAPPELPDEIGRLGGHRILRVIGQGGMGVVFEAEDLQLQRRVAIKVLKPHGLEDTTRERFLQGTAGRIASQPADRHCPSNWRGPWLPVHCHGTLAWRDARRAIEAPADAAGVRGAADHAQSGRRARSGAR